jgi:hypothetical protein
MPFPGTRVSRHHQVALVLAVDVVGDDHDAARRDRDDRGLDSLETALDVPIHAVAECKRV